MCTGFVKKGRDLLFGFNLDIDPAMWSYALYKDERVFTVGITVGKTLYYTHGVNSEGHFGNLPYMNGPVGEGRGPKGKSARIDLLTDRYLRGRYGYEDILEILRTKTVANVPGCSMHSLLADAGGRVLLIEPGSGYREIEGDHAVITNYPLLDVPEDDSPFYGKDRYAAAEGILSRAGEDFTAADGLRLLESVRQTGQWGTRISFVYSAAERCVYYAMEGDFSRVMEHRFP